MFAQSRRFIETLLIAAVAFCLTGVLASSAGADTLPTVTITVPAASAVLGSPDTEIEFESTNSPTSITCKIDAEAAVRCRAN